MAEYTYKDVIIDPSDPRVEIGKEYYFSDNPAQLLRRAKLGDTGYEGSLTIVHENWDDPFTDEVGDKYCCIIRKKELPYAARQTKWLADNGINKGDKVRIVRKADNNEGGWDNFWTPDMDEAVGKVGTVSCISTNWGALGIEVDVLDVGPFSYPYFVLEKVKQKYVPFDLSKEEVRDFLKGKWVKGNINGQDYLFMIIGFKAVAQGWCVDLGGWFTGEDLLAKWTFEDGTPCGKLVEQINDQTN